MVPAARHSSGVHLIRLQWRLNPLQVYDAIHSHRLNPVINHTVLNPLQVYDALPPESRTAHAMLIMPDKPAEVWLAWVAIENDNRSRVGRQ